MRILHLSTFDTAGGAARSAFRLHEGLSLIGVDSRMFVLKASTQAPDVVAFRPKPGLGSRLVRAARRELAKREMRRYRLTRPRGLERFSSDRSINRFEEMKAQFPPHDILHLHWTTGLIDYPSFLSGLEPDVPVVWTLHDMNLFTGGCHFSGSCSRYREWCGRCPQLGSSSEHDLSREVWSRKERLFSSAPNPMHFVAPCEWMAEQARASSLLQGKPVKMIPYAVDVDTFQPRPKQAARQAIGLPENYRVLLFVSNYLGTTRKGLHLLDEALSRLDTTNTLLMAIGYGSVELKSRIPYIRLNHLTSDRLLCAVYSAADLLVLPSLQDNLPNTMMEALACGTPTVAFNVGGIPELVRSGENGLLVPPGDTNSLACAIQRLLQDNELLDRLRQRCREQAVTEYRLEKQANRYLELYRTLLK